jgi:phosphoglucomutase
MTVPLSPLAGKPAPQKILADLAKLERAYFEQRPDLDDPTQRVSFGTSGHRGSSLKGSFNEAHILAISQAICDYRRAEGIDGPLYVGKDTHFLSGPAQRTALEVLAANAAHTIIQSGDGCTPTPVIAHAPDQVSRRLCTAQQVTRGGDAGAPWHRRTAGASPAGERA